MRGIIIPRKIVCGSDGAKDKALPAFPAMLKKDCKEQQLPPNLPKEDFEALPNKLGVYYFRDNKDKVIYVGKAKDLRKCVTNILRAIIPTLNGITFELFILKYSKHHLKS